MTTRYNASRCQFTSIRASLMLPPIEIDDRLRLRKPHPCGSYEWTVVRLGADIGLQCTSCGRRILLSRRELSRRLKSVLTTHDDAPH